MPLLPAQVCQAVSDSYNVEPTVQVADDIRAVITQVAGETIVAIPGTTDIAGWVDDFSTLPVYHSGLGWCHDGFSRCGLLLWMALKPRLKDSLSTTFAGHSLGGALAQVCAVANAYDNGFADTLTTFGSPRVAARWNMTFGPLLKKSLNPTLYVNAGDPVPDVPGKLLFGHKAKHVVLGKPLGGIDPMANHAISLYLKNSTAVS